ncbi:MAG: cation diffusion facilitator family transporter [Pirellulales bacterium]|nr:cation diffusion facilitator family transporter [Pirellulales bacterium]
MGSIGEVNREKRRVAAASLAAAVLLTGTKLGVGLWTNSLGILSEAAHSALDLAAAGITLWAVRVSGRPADREHTYGHGKFENLSALFQSLLLLATCAWIVYEATARLFFQGEPHVEANIWAFLVIIFSIAVDVSRSRALKKAAVKHSSQALEADALHFSTDIWSSAVVLLGLCGVAIGNRFGMPWLVRADAAAALAVAAIVVWISLKLGKKSVNELLDSVPRDLRDRLAAAVGAVPGVAEVRRLRLRRSGPEVFVDATIAVGRGAAFEQAHDVADRVEAALRGLLLRADVVVHVEPTVAADEDATTKIRLLAAKLGLGAHGIRIYEEGDRRRLELHLEVSDKLQLDEAHAQASAFERQLRETLPWANEVVTHIEPTGDDAAVVKSRPAGQAGVQKAISDFLAANPLPIAPHEIQTRLAGGELDVSFHCTLEATTAIIEAHDLTVRLEEFLRSRVPGLGRVVIHVEPK